jgi:hypothetical protein
MRLQDEAKARLHISHDSVGTTISGGQSWQTASFTVPGLRCTWSCRRPAAAVGMRLRRAPVEASAIEVAI